MTIQERKEALDAAVAELDKVIAEIEAVFKATWTISEHEWDRQCRCSYVAWIQVDGKFRLMAGQGPIANRKPLINSDLEVKLEAIPALSRLWRKLEGKQEDLVVKTQKGIIEAVQFLQGTKA